MSEHGNVDMMFSFLPNIDGYSASSVTLLTDITGASQKDINVSGLISIVVTAETIDTNQYIIFKTLRDSTLIDQANYLIGPMSYIDWNVRIFIYDQYISGYCNDTCVYTYALYSASYNEHVSLSMLISDNLIDIYNIIVRELPDAREAVYVDYEATTESAIQSIIQQRPVEINPDIDRKLGFTYDATKDSITDINNFINSYEDVVQDNMQMSSDGIVYYSDVGVAINEDTAKEVGFITRIYRLSELTTGAISGAKKYQRVALQKRHSINIVINRLDPRIEGRDVIEVNLVTTGTKRNIIDSVIVEDVAIKVADGSYLTIISGRKNG